MAMIPEVKQYGLAGAIWKLWSARALVLLTIFTCVLGVIDVLTGILPTGWYIALIIIGNFGILLLRVFKQDDLKRYEI